MIALESLSEKRITFTRAKTTDGEEILLIRIFHEDYISTVYHCQLPKDKKADLMRELEKTL